MCIRISFGHSDEQLVEAQWAVVNALRRAVYHGSSHPDARRTLHDALARAHASSPEQWAVESAEALVQAIARLQTATANDDLEIQSLRLRCEHLQQLVDRYNQNPLQERLKTISQERDHWREEAEQLTRRVRSLEEALARAQQAHQSEVAALQATISDLNRIIVEQQEELNAHNT